MLGDKGASRERMAWLGLVLGISTAACNSVAGLEDYSVDPSAETTQAALCTTNTECTQEATRAAGNGEIVQAMCVKPEGRCAPLVSEDCQTITGELDDNSIVIGSMFDFTKGAQAATNLQRQQSAMLAVTQINKVGGIPSNEGTSSKLVLVSCDQSVNLTRAGKHLVETLKVPAIVGPSTSQTTLDLSTEVTIPSGTVVMSPTAVASSITALVDNDLTYAMVPTDVQRTPLMVNQINHLEAQLKAERDKDFVKLGIIYRDDALGIGTRTGLNDLVINGKMLSHATNLGTNVKISPYDFNKPDQDAIVQEYLQFAPDIVVLAGTAEAISHVMKPLEEQWPASNPDRPHYVLIDPTKVPDLLALAATRDELRQRVRGTGITPSSRSMGVFDSFKVDYQVAYPGGIGIVSGMAPAYDATYGIAFAIAATRNEPVTGATVKAGLRKLAAGTVPVEIGATRALQGFQKLLSGEPVSAIGTFSALSWDRDGAVMGGTIEMWCIGAPAGKPAYQSSGLTYDLETKKEEGSFTPCAP